MSLPDLTGQNIENTYPRLVQTDGINFYDGTGSAVNFGVNPFPYTGSAIISGSLIVTGSTNSSGGFTGSLLGTSSWATNALTASYALNVAGRVGTGSNATASFVNQSVWIFNHNLNNKFVIVQAYNEGDKQVIPKDIQLVDSNNVIISFPSSQSGYVVASLGGIAVSSTNALTASFITSSNVFGPFGSNSIVSSSFSLTASYALNGGGNIDTSSLITTSSFNSFTASYNTGSFSGSFIGELIGTSSWAQNALTASFIIASNIQGIVLSSSYALTASFAPDYVLTSVTSSMLAPYVLNSQTSSFVTNTQTSSFVQNFQTSSFVLNSQTSSMLEPYVLITVTSSMLEPYLLSSQTSSFIINSQTGSFVTNNQTGSFVQNSQTSSFVLNSQTSSFVQNSQTSSMTVLSSSYALTASHATTASYLSTLQSELNSIIIFNMFI